MKRGCGFTLAMVAGIGLIALIAGGAAFQKINEQPWFCNTCHEMNFHYASWQASTHGPEARCLDCHASPGVRGFIEEKVRGAEQLNDVRSQVRCHACPRGAHCHPARAMSQIRSGPSGPPHLKFGVRMSISAHCVSTARGACAATLPSASQPVGCTGQRLPHANPA